MKIIIDTDNKTVEVIGEENPLELYSILNKLDDSYKVIKRLSFIEELKRQKREREEYESKVQNVNSMFLKIGDIKPNVTT